MGEEIPPIVQLEECLRNGVILARLARVFEPHLVPRIFEAEKLSEEEIYRARKMVDSNEELKKQVEELRTMYRANPP